MSGSELPLEVSGSGLPLDPPGEGFGPSARLRRRQDFVRCYRRGRKKHGAFASLHFHRRQPLENPSTQGAIPGDPRFSEGHETRLGITASRKVGKAVIRHRVKRRVREIFRRWRQRSSLGPVDIVVHLKPAAAGAGFEEFDRELRRLLGKVARLNSRS